MSAVTATPALDGVAAPLGELADIQYSSPSGRFVSSSWLPADQLAVGQLVRDAGGWAVITAVGVAPVPAVRLLTHTGDTVHTLAPGGLEVRSDGHIDPSTLPTPGAGHV